MQLAHDLSRQAGGQQQALAIYIRDLDSTSQFYTVAGQWIHCSSQDAQFYVPGFVPAQELDKIIPYLPTTPQIQSSKISQTNLQSVPREVGKPLIDKMAKFWAQSDSVYQSVATRLDNAYSLTAHVRFFGYATLDEIAKTLLPEDTTRNNDGMFPPHVLYAVHRSLLRDDIGFRPQSRGTLRAGGQYEILPKNYRKGVDTVRDWVREYEESNIAIGRPDKDATGAIRSFVSRARKLVDESRKIRQFTTHGIIGPLPSRSEDQGVDHKNSVQGQKFDEVDMEIIRFMKAWAALDSFTLRSSLNGTGSAILRAIRRYPDDLTPVTAWTMLQEIGAIAPWENRAVYELRMDSPPFNRSAEVIFDELSDKLERIRKPPGPSPVYCIDDPGAHEIDDGISIGPSDAPDEFWIHIHTADPAAFITPESAAARRAQTVAETVYMPERVVPMLFKGFVNSKVSLDSGRPCLNFSAKMNMDGDILEYNVDAGILPKVVYLSYDVLKGIVSETDRPDRNHLSYEVGPPMPPVVGPFRRMRGPDDISDGQKQDLRLLEKIGNARAAKLKARGGVSGGGSGLSVAVDLNKGEIFHSSSKYSYRYQNDPTILLRTDGVDEEINRSSYAQGNTVQNFMLVAGEVAARWCSERGIPVPYRVTPRNHDTIDPTEFYIQNVIPSMDENGNPSTEALFSYMKLLGVQPSSTPGPHVAIGVDMMAKCTSPLRRYGDLLLHMQVEAALLKEHEQKKSLVGNTRDDFLPFSKNQLDDLLPQLDTRERLISYGKRQADRHWICQYLVRAWKFGEGQLPSKLPYLVTRVDPTRSRVFGTLMTFATSAECVVSEEQFVNMKEGEKFEVELEDVNVYLRSIKVKLLPTGTEI